MVVLAIVIASSLWVYFDAKSIGVRKDLISGFWNLSAGGWCIASLLLWIIIFPGYLIKRGTLKAAAAAEADNPPSIERSAATESEAIGSLEKLADLRDRGVLTGEEFEQKKQQLLST